MNLNLSSKSLDLSTPLEPKSIDDTLILLEVDEEFVPISFKFNPESKLSNIKII